ncbi:MAG: hypothetical protein DMF90_12285, partial [Acidobacteria bacterium]
MAENDMPGGTGDAPPAVDQGAPAEAVPTKRATAELKAILEALICASPGPLTPRTVSRLLASEPKENVLEAL